MHKPWFAGLTSMKRTLVFVLLGPILGVLAAFSMVTVLFGGGFDTYGFPIVLFFSVVLCAITAPVDGVLAYVAPISIRAPLTAIVGAAVCVGIRWYLWSQTGNKMVTPTLSSEFPIAIIGALMTGMCSLLAHNYRR
jgi:asparagine N-glycosylation enzyme membrane subunit Stt3